MPRPWRYARNFGLIRPVFVEPENEAAAKLRSHDPKAIIVPYALGSEDGKHETLRVTVQPGQSSLLFPDQSNPYLDESWTVVKEVPITVRRLDKVWDASWGQPDFIKIDVHGYELEVIAGMGDLLSNTLCVELECSFIPFYIGQPLFHQVHDVMRAHGFDLVKIRPIGLYGGVSVIEFNAYFVRSNCHGDPRAKLWKAVNDVGKTRRIWEKGY